MYSNNKTVKRKLLITGANGFIGSYLTEEAIKSGFDVYAGVRKTSNREYLKGLPVKYVELDMENPVKLKAMIENAGGFDFVINGAGITKTCKMEEFDRVNFQLSKNLIEALIATVIPLKFIQISSLAAYGPGTPGKMEPIKDEGKPSPVSYYGKSKLKLENYIRSLDGFPYLIFRPTSVYGPRDKAFFILYKSIEKGIETFVGTKKQYLSFIYIKDLAKLLVEALNSDFEQKTYFVSDMKNYTALEFNDTVKRELNKKTVRIVFPKPFVKGVAWSGEKLSCLLRKEAPVLNTDKYKELVQSNWLCDSSALVNDFDFRPQYNLEQGLKETLQWYKNQK